MYKNNMIFKLFIFFLLFYDIELISAAKTMTREEFIEYQDKQDDQEIRERQREYANKLIQSKSAVIPKEESKEIKENLEINNELEYENLDIKNLNNSFKDLSQKHHIMAKYFSRKTLKSLISKLKSNPGKSKKFVEDIYKMIENLLRYACAKGNFKIVDFLLSRGVDINSKDENGFSALMFLILAKNPNSSFEQYLFNRKIKKLLNYIEKGDKKEILILALQTENQDFINNLTGVLFPHDEIETLNEYLPYLNQKIRKSLFYYIVNKNHLKQAQLLLDQGIEIDTINSTFRDFNITENSFEIIRLLLNHKADINIKNKLGQNILIRCFNYFNSKYVILGIHEEFVEKIDKIFKFIIENNASVNSQDKKGYSILMLVTKYIYDKSVHDTTYEIMTNMANMLLQNGADPNIAPNDKSETFLDVYDYFFYTPEIMPLLNLYKNKLLGEFYSRTNLPTSLCDIVFCYLNLHKEKIKENNEGLDFEENNEHQDLEIESNQQEDGSFIQSQNPWIDQTMIQLLMPDDSNS